MKLEVADITATPYTKPHVPKGFYRARLTDAKPKKKEGKYGRKIVLLFELLDENTIEGKPVQLPLAVYSEYRQDDGSYRSAVSPNARITKVFEVLGWIFAKEGLDTDEFVRAEVEVLVDDYTYEMTNPTTLQREKRIASKIADVKRIDEVSRA